MPAPEKTKKPKKLDKGKKGEVAKKKKGSGNLLIILSVVGVVVLVGVGITIFMLMSGDKNPPPVNSGNQNQRASVIDNQPPAEDGTAGNAAGLAEITTKMNDLIEKLGDPAKMEEAAAQLKELLNSDLGSKAAGRNLILNALKDKALANNDAAKQLLQKLSKDSSNATLAQAALKIYNEHLRQSGDATGAEVELGEEPTNYLPNKVDVVFSMSLRKFMDSEYNKGVFTPGAFNLNDVPKRIGMAANTVEHLVVGGVTDFSQVVGVIRTTNPYPWDDVKKAMQIEESGNTIKGKTYYLGKIDFMTEFLGQRVPGIDALRDKAAFWRADPRTLVYADETTMKDLLENPPEKNKALEAPVTASLPGGNTPAGNNTGAVGGAGLTAGGADAGSGNSGNRSNNDAAPGGGTSVAGGSAAPGGEEAKKPSEPVKNERFMTIDTKMRRLIKLTEDPKNESLVLFTDKATSKVPVLVNYVTYLERLTSVRSKEIDTLVFALPATTGSPSLKVGLACKSRAVVRDVSADIEKLLGKIGKEDLRDLFGFDFTLSQTVVNNDNQNSAPAGGRGFGGGVGSGLSAAGGAGGGGAGQFGGDLMAGGGNRGGGGGGVGQGSGGSGPGGPPGGGVLGGGLSAGAGGGGNSAGMGIQSGPGGGPGSQGPGNPGGQEQPAEDAPGTLRMERSDEYIIITASVKSSLSDFIDKHMRSWMQQIRGSQEMASGKFRFGDLAASIDYYKADLARNNKTVTFPQGAYPRTFDAERGPRPYPANERISFLRELLPYLNDDRYYGMHADIDPEKSWRDPHNQKFARILVPHFLNPAAGTGAAYVKVRGVDTPLAVTHFVGMAGVGPDAAYLPKSDPRAGIFGYDRVAAPDEVKDGLSNTIFMIEADKTLLGPWLEGGGSTVRGTSIAGNDVGRRGGFSSPSYSGKPGVWVLMADGSTRYLTKDVSPEVFKALCTMAGSDSAGAIDLIAGKVSLDVTPRSEQATAVSTTKKKRVTEEEEVPLKK